jgi:hypothetical protein
MQFVQNKQFKILKEKISGLNFTAGRHNGTINRKAEVAQLVEQLIRNQQVVGSSPTFGSTLSSAITISYK